MWKANISSVSPDDEKILVFKGRGVEWCVYILSFNLYPTMVDQLTKQGTLSDIKKML